MELSQNISLLELIKNNPDTEFSIALYQAYNDEIKSIDAKIEEYTNDLKSLVTLMMDFLKNPLDTGIDKILFLKALDETKNMIIIKLNELVFRKTTLQLFEPRAVRKSMPGEIEEINGGGPVPELLAAALISAMLIPEVAGLSWSLFGFGESEEEKIKIINEIMEKRDKLYKNKADESLNEGYIYIVDELKKKSLAELNAELKLTNNLMEQKNKSEIIDKIIGKENEKLKLSSQPEMTSQEISGRNMELHKKRLDELITYTENLQIQIDEKTTENYKQKLLDDIVGYYKILSNQGFMPDEEERLRENLSKYDIPELKDKITELKKIQEKRKMPYKPEETYNRISSEITAYRAPDMAVEVKDYSSNSTSFVEATKSMSSASSYFEKLVTAAPPRQDRNLISQKFKEENAPSENSFIGFNSEIQVWYIDFVSIAQQDAVDYVKEIVSKTGESDERFPLQHTMLQIENLSKENITVSESGYSYPIVIPDGINKGIANQLTTVYQAQAFKTINDLTIGTRAIIDKVNEDMSKILNNIIETISDSIIKLNSECKITSHIDDKGQQQCKGYNDAFKGLSPSYFKLYMDEVEQRLKPIMSQEENIKNVDVATGDVEKDIQNLRDRNDYGIITKNIELIKQNITSIFGQNTKNILEITDKTTISEFLAKNTPSFYYEKNPNGNMFVNLNVQTNMLNLKFLAYALNEYSHQKYVDLYTANEEAIKGCEESKPGFFMSLFKSSETSECGLSIETQNNLRKLLNDKLKIDKFKNIILQVSQIEERLKSNLNIHNLLQELSESINAIGNRELSDEQLEKLAQMKQSSLFEDETNEILRQNEQKIKQKRLKDINDKSILLKAQKDLIMDDVIIQALNSSYTKWATVPALGAYNLGVGAYNLGVGAREGLGFTEQGIFRPEVFNWGALIASILSFFYVARKIKQIVFTPLYLAKAFFSSIFNISKNVGVKIIDGTSATAKMIWDNKGEIFYYSVTTAAAGGIWYTLYCMMYETFIQELLPSNEILKGLYFIVSVGSGIVIKLVLTNGYTICLGIDIKTMSVTMFGKPIDKSTLYKLNEEKWIDEVSKKEYTITRDDKTNHILPTITNVSGTFIVQLNDKEGVIVSDKNNSEFIREFSEEEFYKKVVPDKEDPTTYIVDGDPSWAIETGLNSQELCFNDNKWFETTYYFVNFPRRSLITKLYNKINFLGRIKDVKGGKKKIGKKTRRKNNKKIINKSKKIHKKRNLKTKNKNRRNKTKNRRNKTKNKAKK